MASGKISGDYGKVRYVDYTIPSREYGAGVYTAREGNKSAEFGIPNNAKVIGVSNLDAVNGYKVVAFAVNDYESIGYLRILTHNTQASAITAELPIRIFYTL